MGRPRRYLSAEDITSARQGRTVTEAARYLGVGRTTLVKYINELGLNTGSGNYVRRYRERRKRSTVSKRLEEYNKKNMPGDHRAIGEALGLPPKIVYSYFYRGRRRARRWFESRFTRTSSDTVFVDSLDRRIPFGAFDYYRIFIDKWGTKVRIKARLKSGQDAWFDYKMSELKRLID